MTTVATQSNLAKAKIQLAPPAKAPTPVKATVKAAPVVAPSKAATPTVSIGTNAKPAPGLYSAAGKIASPAASAAEPKDAAPAQPEALAMIAGGVISGAGRVVVDIQASDSGYDNKIFYSTDNFKTRQYIGIDNKTGSVDLGTFKAGTTINFGIDNGQGDFFKTGTAAANTDKVEHAKMTSTGDGAIQIGFEDLRGGGDRDFNDAIIKVRSVPVAAPDTKSNHSGLGDGTNPGQGSGTVNSPNQGANNPGGTPAPKADTGKAEIMPVPAKPTPAEAQLKAKAKADQAAEAKAAAAAEAQLKAKAKADQAAEAKAAAAAAAKAAAFAAALKSNRSGLGDGTNPGQGAGTVKSPNSGTLNPGGLRKF